MTGPLFLKVFVAKNRCWKTISFSFNKKVGIRFLPHLCLSVWRSRFCQLAQKNRAVGFPPWFPSWGHRGFCADLAERVEYHFFGGWAFPTRSWSHGNPRGPYPYATPPIKNRVLIRPYEGTMVVKVVNSPFTIWVFPKNRGFSPKMDGENDGNHYFLMDDLGHPFAAFPWWPPAPEKIPARRAGVEWDGGGEPGWRLREDGVLKPRLGWEPYFKRT